MNEEQINALATALYRQRVAEARVPAGNEAALDSIWAQVANEIKTMDERQFSALYRQHLGPIEAAAGRMARELGKADSTTYLQSLFSAPEALRDSAVTAFGPGAQAPRQEPAQEAAPDPLAPFLRGREVSPGVRNAMMQSPTVATMRVPGMTPERALAMPRGVQNSIARSDQVNARPAASGAAGGLYNAAADFMGQRGRLAEDMDDMGVTAGQRFGTGVAYGLVNAPHRLMKGVLGITRVGPNNLYDAYERFTQPFEDSYDQVTPAMGKLGLAGEMVGGAPVDIPLYATGTRAVSSIPRVASVLRNGSRLAQAGARIGTNAAVDAAQGGLMAAGEEDPSMANFGANVGFNVGFGMPFNVLGEMLGGFGKQAARTAPTADAGAPRPQIDGVGSQVNAAPSGRSADDIEIDRMMNERRKREQLMNAFFARPRTEIP